MDFGEGSGDGGAPLAASGDGGSGVPPASPEAPPPADTANAKFWTIQYYRFLFNVDTTQVLQRILRSVTPFRFGFIETAKGNPDLYVCYFIFSK